ncbi:MAG: PEPxxWA-CTERM sorting domain-containing protein [Sandarakinorhabdus sp.]|jgi:hypothetical protein|nr:PEPxxWA-CTERM sorting domain-containing protein [Sandarakinorhabdus sp.]
MARINRDGMRLWRWGVRAVQAAILGLALPGMAVAGQVMVMTPETVTTALAAARPGDTIRMEGVFANAMLWRNRDFGGVTLDASAATITGGLRMVNVQNIRFSGGDWRAPGTGDAIRIENSAHVSLGDVLVSGSGDRLGAGVRVLRSSHITVRDSRFEGLRNSTILSSVTDSLVTRNRFANGGEDGMKILDSQRLIASHNSCTGFAPLPDYHADCIQLWSVPANPVQSDIYLLNNLAIGPQQAFVSFDPDDFSATRLTFVGNYAATTSPHTITCLGCTDSLFADNMLIVMPDAPWAAAMKITGSGSGNVYGDNPYFDLRGQHGITLPDPVFSSFTPSLAGLVGSQWDDRSFGLAQATSAPEPASWVMLMAGFGLVGSALRRRVRRKRVGLPGCAA